ncbi:hypothetical protein E2C01_007837 [Portunus trituberculatus]|uniref:Uncharacterized protein n=1 Tax=Portunus trituberculatus TaxID=210409 RepID=A0A5B7D288_PORTR|nr:hypothetical protein [Portunus trituberculatus]
MVDKGRVGMGYTLFSQEDIKTSPPTSAISSEGAQCCESQVFFFSEKETNNQDEMLSHWGLLLTIKDKRVAIPEVDEGRKGLDAITFSQLSILDLHHVDAVHVTLIINVFQLC